jgi:hypothetical protein
MSHRPSLSALAALGLAALLVAMPAAGQTAPKSPAQSSATPAGATAIPRTADGHPDLSGVFTNATNVPVTRPANLGAKEFYANESEQQAQRQASAAGGRGGRGGRPIDPETGEPALAVHYDISQFGYASNEVTHAPSLRTSIITGPEGRVPPLTPEAQKRLADNRAANNAHQFDGPENRPLPERCLLWQGEGPPMMPEPFDSNIQIVQGEGYVSVLQEMIHDARLIPTDGRPHLPENVRQWMGDARGHWEGDTLVVETTNFTDRTLVQQAPTTTKLKVIERFSRVDANTVLYQYTVNDPGTWTKPWSGELTMTKINGPIYEYACNEGNYGLANNLSGARATEKK